MVISRILSLLFPPRKNPEPMPSAETLLLPVVRYADESDVERLSRLEQATAQEDYWGAADFGQLIRTKSYHCLLMEHGDDFLGYVAFRVRRDANILLSLVVHPHHQRKGVGSALLECLKGIPDERRRERILASVRESNLSGQLFLKANGFVCIETEDDFFEAPPETGFKFEWEAI